MGLSILLNCPGPGGDDGEDRWSHSSLRFGKAWLLQGYPFPAIPGFGLEVTRSLEGLWVEVRQGVARGIQEQFPETRGQDAG